MKRTKVSCVMQHGIAHYERLEVVNICRGRAFSIIVNERTDFSKNQMAILELPVP